MLRAEVEARFGETGRHTPGWPAPHPDRTEPAEEEYSRLLDPAKYRILDARVRAWLDVLVARGAATVVAADPVPEVRRAAMRPEEAVRVLPTATGAVPLLVGLRSIDGVPRAVLDLAVGEPPASVLQIPHCGCDACDDGSAPLLEQLDDQLAEIVTGRFVRVAGADWSLQTTTDGASGSGPLPRDWDEIPDRVRAGDPTYDALHGRPWL